MASQIRNHKPAVSNCICSACKSEANAPPGKPHRNCSKKNDDGNQGVWEKK